MKYIRTYESFKDRRNQSIDGDPVNEEIFGALKKLWNSATGALKNFLGGTEQTNKQVDDTYNKDLKPEEIKKNLATTVDGIMKNCIDNINKAEDEKGVSDIIDAFRKQLDDKMMEFDKKTKEASAKKESFLYSGDIINEVNQTKLSITTAFKVLSDYAKNFKQEYDKKMAAAKDLAGKKAVAVEEIKKIVEEFKKKLNDDKAFAAEIEKYKADNKIEGGDGMSYAKLKEFFDKKIPVIYKLKDFKDDEWNKLTPDQKKKPSEEPASKLVAVKVMNSLNDQNKEDSVIFLDKDEKPTIKKSYKDIIGPSEEKAPGQDDLVNSLKEIKQKDPNAIKDIGDIIKPFEDTKKNAKTIEDMKKLASEAAPKES